MAYSKEKLIEAVKQIEKKTELTERLRELNVERYPLNNKVIKLETALNQAVEQENELNKGGLSSFLHKMTGKLDAKREEAHKEVVKAKREYDNAAGQLNSIDDELARVQEALNKVYNSEKEYKQLIEDKIAAIKSSNHPDKAKLLEIEKEITALEGQLLEIKGVMISGSSVKHTAGRILSLSDTSGDISVTDVLFKTPIGIAEAASYSHDRHKQAKEMKLKGVEQLRRFKQQLADISDFAKNHEDISYFYKFFEIVDKISADNKMVPWDKLVYQLEAMTNKLDALAGVVDNKIKDAKNSFDALVNEIDI